MVMLCFNDVCIFSAPQVFVSKLLCEVDYEGWIIVWLLQLCIVV